MASCVSVLVSVFSKVIKEIKKKGSWAHTYEIFSLDGGSARTVADCWNQSMRSHVKANSLTHLSALTSSRPSLNKKTHVTSSCGCPMLAGGLYCSIQRTVSECFGKKWIYSPIGPDIRDADKRKTEWQFLTEEHWDYMHSRPWWTFWNGWMLWPNLQTPHTLFQQDSSHTQRTTHVRPLGSHDISFFTWQ